MDDMTAAEYGSILNHACADYAEITGTIGEWVFARCQVCGKEGGGIMTEGLSFGGEDEG